ncbi:uncharacterized protein LOC117645559 [Thrips palmi]|uniref:Uncharacterized protein LOC117645559 n=1 Tax=Thrips palmi TaxID=161013 RepID=A0A6P8YP57_THRPL|nr:uncharacterized protein LOC117645559 [Thrips palmi]
MIMDSESMNSAGIIISPSTHQKIKARNAAMRLKHGVPQFKDVLRKRFHSRIKENRGRLFDRLRDVSGLQGGSVSKIIQQELANILDNELLMDSDDEMRIKQEMEFEVFGPEENWVMHQYDLLMADDNALQELWEEAQLVVCPVCRRGNLSCDVFNQLISCGNCRMAVPARASIQEIQDRIYVIINNHSETGCPEVTHFFVSHEDSSLYAHCNTCPFFDLTV